MQFLISSLINVAPASVMPSPVMNKPIVVIDFGHGQKQGRGFETGAAEGGVYEARVAEAVGSQLSDILKQEYGAITVETRADVNDHDGFQFDRYSRFANQDKSLQIRAELVSELRDRFPDAPVLFVSIHTNRAVGADGKNIPTVHGGLVFSYSPTEGGASGSVESRKLARDIASHYSLRKRTQARTEDFAVLRCQYEDTPAVLVELGFNTNPEDRAVFKSIIVSADVARRYADKLAQGIGAYLDGRERDKPRAHTQIAMNSP